MHCALRAQPESIIEPVHKNMTQFLYSDGFQQRSLQEAGLHPKSTQLMEKLLFISVGFGSGP